MGDGENREGDGRELVRERGMREIEKESGTEIGGARERYTLIKKEPWLSFIYNEICARNKDKGGWGKGYCEKSLDHYLTGY